MLTPGFIADQERLDAKRAIDAARRANVAVYFVDARGLVASTPYAQAQQTGRGLDSRDVGAANAEMTLGAEGAAEIAQSTGGFSVRNQNDLGRGLQRDRRRVARLLPARLPAGQGRQGRRLPAARGEGHAARRHGAGAPRLLRRRPPGRGAPAAGGADAAAVQRRRRRASTAPRIALRARRHPAAGRRSRLRRGERRIRPSSCWWSRPTCAPSGSRPRTASCPTSLDLRVLTTELGTNATERYERKVEMSFPDGTRFGAGLLASAVAGVPPEAGTLPGARRACATPTAAASAASPTTSSCRR